jgi:DNA repair photolyase
MDLTINPYRGCEFGCRYCYARYTHQWLDEPDPLAFERQIYAKTEAPAKLAAELARMNLAGRSIAIGTATDPYQPVERRLELTRGLLEALCGCRGAYLRLTTKSDLVVRDIDLLTKLHERHELIVAMTLVTLDRAMQRKLEPRAPTPEKRLAAMRQLAEAGLTVALLLAPLLPGVNDSDEAIEQVVAAAAQAGATLVWSQLLWVPSTSKAILFDWLGEQFPEQVRRYQRLYADDVDAPEALRAAASQRVAAAMARHGLGSRPRGRPEAARQLSLWDE